ncbi:hypothetical protein [Hoeflea ulvae]|uniref:Uncharacterized protein n=1 Tax=Hoeflea ulvae TaxID=2983764 RepID=A0ABT3YIH7_9HYPH|nr:hypothetical protein [Hoeflea ulvae]MCY0095709.1 hypothetical protein [Hoeflea ulvae]
MKRRTISIILAGVTISSALGLILANPDPFVRNELCNLWCPRSANPQFWNAIIFDLSVGAISSVIFYLLLVALPDTRRHQKLKRSLLRRYEEFRRECVSQLLYASGNASIGMSEVEVLMKPSSFKDHFYGDPWQTAASAFNYDEHHCYLEDTKLAAQRFKAEVDYVLDQVDIDDDEIFERLKLLSDSLDRLTRTTREYDSVKSLFRDLWAIFTGWDFSDGQYGRDRIRELLEAI